MQFSNPVRTDLIIAMTLAETFLLLLLIVWYSVVKKPASLEVPSQVEILNAQIAGLKDEVKELRRKLVDSNRRLEYWRTRFKLLPPASDGEFAELIKSREFTELVHQLGRGKPACDVNNNVLLEVSFVDGQESVTLLRDLAGLNLPWGAGTILTQPADIATLINSIVAHAGRMGTNGSQCAFDYRLAYKTAEDYLVGREKYERFFYPAGIRRK